MVNLDLFLEGHSPCEDKWPSPLDSALYVALR